MHALQIELIAQIMASINTIIVSMYVGQNIRRTKVLCIDNLKIIRRKTFTVTSKTFLLSGLVLASKLLQIRICRKTSTVQEFYVS